MSNVTRVPAICRGGPELLIDESHPSYSLVRKRFTSIPADSKKEARALLNRFPENEVFYLRFYIPKFLLGSITQVWIMINGLNETGDHFGLYDQLGEELAKKGIASVLLPTPHHLNRHSIKDKKMPHEYLFERPLLIYHNTKQSMRDVQELIRLLTKPPATDEFYAKYFGSRNLRISILGYSLGGLRALASFMIHHTSLDCCFMISSGFRLHNLRLSTIKISEEAYKAFLSKLEEDLSKKENFPIRQEPYFDKYFSPIFLGSCPAYISSVLATSENCVRDRVFQIIGGKDEVVPPYYERSDNVYVKNFSFTHHPRLPHLLRSSTYWKESVKFLIDQFELFEKFHAARIWSRKKSDLLQLAKESNGGNQVLTLPP